jgi:uncharacterized protein (DUF169 family)
MGDKKEWQEYAAILKEVLHLELSPVAVRCVKKDPSLVDPAKSKIRICKALINAAHGAPSAICRENNACFGASWHLGFVRTDNPKVMDMVRKFVVEGEKLFSSYQALDALMGQMDSVPDNADTAFQLSPLETAEDAPAVVIFVCNPEEACRLLTLSVFIDGIMPRIKIGGPTCRMTIMYPLTANEVNLSFYDYTARKLCAVEKDKLLVSIPYSRMPKIIESIETCSAGKGTIEFPPEFRAFLQKNLGK